MKNKERLHINYGSWDIELLSRWKTQELIKEEVKKLSREYYDELRKLNNKIDENTLKHNQILKIFRELKK